ncbi:MAG: antibiotic biosynthesis monooxygenase [Pararhizobium sp.]
MTRIAGVVVFKAKPGLGEEVTKRIAAVLPAVEEEPGTRLWLLLRSNASADTIFLVDLFDSEGSLNSHMKGNAASQIFATVPELLAAEPELYPSAVIASKPALPSPEPGLQSAPEH